MFNLFKIFFPFGISGVFFHTQVWDETLPVGTRSLNLGDDDIRSFKTAVRERLQLGGMYFPSADDPLAGEYSYLRMAEQASNPAAVANKGFLFTKDVSGVTELYYMTDAGTAVQLTTSGKLMIASLFIASESQGDMIYRGASAWSRLAPGTSGQYLKTQGVGANPLWATIPTYPAATAAPSFGASSSATQSINNTTFTKVTYDTKEFDTNSAFSASRFTPGVAGEYQINGGCDLTLSVGDVVEVAIYKNGAAFKSARYGVGGNNQVKCSISSVIDMNATDYVEIYVYHNHGSAVNVVNSTGTHFSGARVG